MYNNPMYDDESMYTNFYKKSYIISNKKHDDDLVYYSRSNETKLANTERELNLMAYAVRDLKSKYDDAKSNELILYQRLQKANDEIKELKQKIKKETELINEIDSSPDEKTTIDEHLCTICLENKKKVLFEPCRHVVSCHKCTNDLKEYKCPMCRQNITRMVTIYYC